MEEMKLSTEPPHTSPSLPYRYHGIHPVRGLDDVPRSSLYEGRFGRMFRKLAPLAADDLDLIALAHTMIEPKEDDDGDDSGDNPAIPAGFTYLGQLLDHDITFDPNSKLQRDNDPNALRNFRTPRLDLDSLYADGPADNPYIYASDGVHLLVGKNSAGEDDLPRNSADPRRALIGDPRNDENAIVSQLHLAFIKYHNHVADALGRSHLTGEKIFDEARQIVRWHYQWLIIHDFLHHLLGGDDVINDIIQRKKYKVPFGKGGANVETLKVELRFFEWKNQPFIPVEFSAAAYRFGHSMVRGDYALNAATVDHEVPIFSLTEPDLRGFQERRQGLEIEWAHFFAFPENEAKDAPVKFQTTRRIDTKLALGLSTLPESITGALPPTPVGRMLKGLALRNLMRGKALGLPSGQAVARIMGFPDKLILSREQLAFSSRARNPLDPPSVRNLASAFSEYTPLWYYILKEAEVMCGGLKLGPVGGRIIAEVIIGLIAGDPLSYLTIDPNWHPRKGEFGAMEDNKFSITDLLRFAGAKICRQGGRKKAGNRKDR